MRDIANTESGFLHLRSRSFDDKDFMHLEDCLTLPRMQIDVDLCAQCLIMNRRKIHVEAVVAALRLSRSLLIYPDPMLSVCVSVDIFTIYIGI